EEPDRRERLQDTQPEGRAANAAARQREADKRLVRALPDVLLAFVLVNLFGGRGCLWCCHGRAIRTAELARIKRKSHDLSCLRRSGDLREKNVGETRWDRASYSLRTGLLFHLETTVMPVSRIARVAVIGAVLCALPSLALAQAKPFEPTVGQAGKDVVWVPTPQTLVEKMLDLAKVTPQDFLMDLGSGDGRTVIAAAKRGLRAQGIEYNPDMVELSKRN